MGVQYRRNFLKTLSSIGTIGTVLGTTGADVVSATSSSPEEKWENGIRDSWSLTYDNELELGGSLGWYGAPYIDSRSAWEHNLRQISTGSLRKSGDESNTIEHHRMYAESSKDETTFWETSDPEYLGMYPAPGSTSINYDEFMEELGKQALSYFKWLEFPLTVYELGDALVDTKNKDINSDTIEVSLDYESHNRKSDISHYQWFLADHSGYDPAYITVESWMRFTSASYHDSTYGLRWIVELWTDSATLDSKSNDGSDTLSSSETTTTGTWSNFEQVRGAEGLSEVPRAKHPENLTPAEARAIGLERIPPGEIQRRGAELGLHPSQIAEMVKSDGPGYVAHNPPITVRAEAIHGQE